jgi:hypothetical protein
VECPRPRLRDDDEDGAVALAVELDDGEVDERALGDTFAFKSCNAS